MPERRRGGRADELARAVRFAHQPAHGARGGIRIQVHAESLQIIWRSFNVIVAEQHVRSARLLDPGVALQANACGSAQPHHREWHRRETQFTRIQRWIAGINDDQLLRQAGLRVERGEGAGQAGRPVARRDDHGNRGDCSRAAAGAGLRALPISGHVMLQGRVYWRHTRAQSQHPA